ncbi:MAG: L-threonylcarbamoyladenylate synthase, partial [Nitrolancea sp.]
MTEPRSRLISAQDPDAIRVASQALTRGELVVFPTDTVYGIGAAVDRPEAVANLYVAKGRPLDKPIPVLISNFEQLSRLAINFDERAERVARAFWPGGLTIVLEAVDWLPKEIVGDTRRVGLRMPDHQFALDLIAQSRGALATTSANRSGEPAATSAEDALAALGDRAAVVVDDGPSPGGTSSTVI